jgi:hypothetical protein
MIKSTYKPFRSAPKDKDLDQIDKLRKDLGLRTIRSGKRDCLKCERLFYSYDLANEKICEKCKEHTDKSD